LKHRHGEKLKGQSGRLKKKGTGIIENTKLHGHYTKKTPTKKPPTAHVAFAGSCFSRPGGTSDISPTLQRWVPADFAERVPEGRLNAQDSQRKPDLSRPFGTHALFAGGPNAEALGYFHFSLRETITHLFEASSCRWL
jgi:hypothetical protein